MSIANQSREDLVRCIRIDKINGEEKERVVMMQPAIVKNDWLFKATGLKIADPNYEQKIKETAQPPVEPQGASVASEGGNSPLNASEAEPPQEPVISIQALDNSETKYPAKKRGRKPKTSK